MSKEKEGKEKNNKKAPAMNLMEKRAAKAAKRNGKNNMNTGILFAKTAEKPAKIVKK
jgi:hypothetical protein